MEVRLDCADYVSLSADVDGIAGVFCVRRSNHNIDE